MILLNRVWSNFEGVLQLRLEDQKMLHLKVLGIPMPDHVSTEAARIVAEESRKKTEAEAAKQRAKYAAKGEEAAVFASSDTDMLLRDLLAKHLDKLVVPELKATCAEHQIVLDKKAKRANIVKAILSVELSKIPGLMYQCLAKGCSVDNLKVLLKGKAQPVSGTKEVLLQRLLQSLGATPPSAAQISTAQVKPKEKKKKDSLSDYYHSQYGMYKKDEEDGEFVRLAKSGSLPELEAAIAKLPKAGTERAAKLNHARRWTEVEEKWGYDKSWEWFGSTAITAAARRGEVAMVKALLVAGADPTLVGCHTDDVHQNAVKAAEHSMKNAKDAVKNLREGRLDWRQESKLKTGEYGFNVDQQASTIARNQLERLAMTSSVHDLVVLVSKFWPVAGYASSGYSDARMKSFASVSNAPNDNAAMIKEIEVFDLCVNIDEEELQLLTAKCLELLMKKQKLAAEERRKVEDQRAAAAKERQRRVEQGRADALERQRIKTSRVRPNLPATILQQQGSLSSGVRECKSIWCDKLPAFACIQAKCANCCTGPCQRHAK